VNGDWLSYRLADFVPVTPEVYFRLVERVNEAWWPLQLLATALGLAALALAWRGRARLALALLAPAWATSGVLFHLQRYAELNWAAVHFGAAFLVQAALLLALALFGRDPGRRPGGSPRAVIGAALALFGLVVYPVVAVVAGDGWSRAEVFALHPEPTAVATLGLVLLALTGVRAWLALVLPLLWLGVAALTLVALQAAWAWLPAGVLLVALVGLAAGARVGRGAGS
jgi:hypothetical protein